LEVRRRMEQGGMVGIIYGIILLIIGIVGLINIDYFANVYVAGLILILGLLSFVCAGIFGKKKK
jgi:hypothetical protein